MAHDRPLLVEGDTVWRKLPAARIGLVIDGAPFFQAFRALAAHAQRSITALGWDFDTRLDISDREMGRPPLRLARFLDELVAAKEDLVIHLLSWSPSILYVLERDPFLAVRMGWLSHDRLRFELDDTAPVGACHHMKLAVFDGRSALCGGIDLTHHRWDSPAHLPDDPRRVTPLGVHYGPYHDVDLLVQGEVAAALEDVARQRWEHATGRPLETPPALGGDGGELPPWPLPTPPELEGVDVGVVRTLPASITGSPVRETERFLLEAIAAAEHAIYLENQYLTAPILVDALCRRLEEARGPEVVAVLPRQPSGWLENETMGTLTAASLAELLRRDRHGRLRIKAPQHEDKDVFVHSKLLVVDDRAVYVGSANATVRSLTLDTECGLAVDVGRSREGRLGVRRMLTRLVSHHLDLSARELALRLEAGARLRDLVDTPGNHRLVDLTPTWRAEDSTVDTEMLRAVADPQDPLTLQGLLDASARAADLRRAVSAAPDRDGASPTWQRRVGAVVLLLVTVLATGGLLALALAGDHWSALRVTSELASLRATPALAVLVTVAVFVLAGAVAFPLNPLIVAAGAAFGPALGMLVSGLGAMASAALSYGLGLVGSHALRNVLRRYERTVARVQKEGVLAVAALRLLPVAPFPIVNTAAGAVRIRFFDFMFGSAIGLAPGVVLLSVFGDRIRQAAADPSPSVIALALGVLALSFFLLLFARRLAQRRFGHTLGQPTAAP